MKHINKVQNFQIEDIDGCEFGYAPSLGKILISHYWDDEGMPTGMIQAVYSDGSYSVVKPKEAQNNIDSGDWVVFRESSEEVES